MLENVLVECTSYQIAGRLPMSKADSDALEEEIAEAVLQVLHADCKRVGQRFALHIFCRLFYLSLPDIEQVIAHPADAGQAALCRLHAFAPCNSSAMGSKRNV